MGGGTQMAEAAAERGALREVTVFLNHFRDLSDPHLAWKVPCPLEAILLLCLLAVAGWGRDARRYRPVRPKEKLDLLHRLRPFSMAPPRMITSATSSRRRPSYATTHRMIDKPIYGGAYAYGKTRVATGYDRVGRSSHVR
jgi:hypothetical protein